MTIIEAQDRLIRQIKSVLNTWCVVDNMVIPPAFLPAVAVDIESSDVQQHAGGSMEAEKHTFTIYVAVLFEDSRSIRDTRGQVAQAMATILSIPRIYAGRIVYGEDVVIGKRCCIARVSVTYPI